MAFDESKPDASQTVGDAIKSSRANLNDLNDRQKGHEGNNDAHGLVAVKADVEAAKRHIASADEHGLPVVRADVAALKTETQAARGSKAALAERLGVALNPDGSIKLSSLASKWINNADVPSYVSPTSFSVPGDRIGVYIAGVLLRFGTAAGYVYAPVASRSFAGGVTTVQLDPAYAVLTAAISAVDIALIAWDNAVANAVTQANAAIVTMQGQLTALKLVEFGDFTLGKPTASQVIFRYVVTRAMTLPAAFSGSQIKALVAATAATTLTVRKSGAAIGTAQFAAGGTVPALALAAATALAVGDVVDVVAPAAPDATLADLIINFQGVLA